MRPEDIPPHVRQAARRVAQHEALTPKVRQ